jgi:hypothetical protein
MDKPLDVEGHTALTTATPISVILTNAGAAAQEPYLHTLMDFLENNSGAWTRIPVFTNFGGMRTKPLRRFPDDCIAPSPNVELTLVQWVLGLMHCGVHFLGWNYRFPTPVELYLWRACCVYMLAVTIGFGILVLLTVRPGIDFTITIFFVWERQTTKKKNLFRRWALNGPGTCAA